MMKDIIDELEDARNFGNRRQIERIKRMVEKYDPWIPVEVERPTGSPIVFMYSLSNNEYSCSHFTLERSGVAVTHWQPLVPPFFGEGE